MKMLLETDRLLLRPWRVSEAETLHELWTERDPRVPAHRRIGTDGHPTVEDIEDRIRDDSHTNALGLLAAELKGCGDIIGYCGLTENDKVPEDEPELAFESLRRTRGQGHATEASRAVLSWAQASGYLQLWATVSDWNAASPRPREARVHRDRPRRAQRRPRGLAVHDEATGSRTLTTG